MLRRLHGGGVGGVKVAQFLAIELLLFGDRESGARRGERIGRAEFEEIPDAVDVSIFRCIA